MTRPRRGVWITRSQLVARLLFAVSLAAHLLVLYTPAAPPGGQPPWHADKVVHAAVFALVAWTGRRAGVPAGPLFGALIGHAFASELLQEALLPHRYGEIGDTVADLVGVVVGGVLPVSDRGSSRAPAGGTPSS